MYFIISIACLILSTFFFKKAAGTISPKNLNMVSWIFWFQLLIQSFIASILVVYGIDNHYGIQKLYYHESKIYGWLAVQYCMVALPLSMWITLIFTKNKISNTKQWYIFVSKNIEPSITRADKSLRIVLYFLSLISLIAVIYSYLVVGKFPFQGYFIGGDIARLRQVVNREFGGITYIKNILGLGLSPILSYIFYCYYRLYKEKIDLVFFWLLFFSSISIVSFGYAKSPLAFYFLGFFFLKIALGDKISYMKLLKYILFILSLIVIFYFITGFEGGFLDLFSSYNSGILGRILLSQAFGTYMAFDLYPLIYEHIGFSSFTSIFGDSRDRMAREIMIYINPTGINDGVAGVINSLFIAEAWANWGVLGVILSVIWVGFLIQLIYSFFLYGKKTPLTLGIYAYICYTLPITGGINDFIYNPMFFMIFIIFTSIVWFVRLGLGIKQK